MRQVRAKGPNMQQIPRREQELFLKVLSTLGPAYSLHTPEAIFTALKRGDATVNGKEKKIPILYASSNEYPTEGYDRV